MSFNNATGVITAPVSIDDVKTCLGLSTNDVATLCTSDKINMWAKYKPTSYPSAFSDEWYKGSDGNYGITLPGGKNNMAEVKDLYSQEDNGYGYKKPTGGSSSPYRLGDFRNYNSKAYPPISSFEVVSSWNNSHTTVNASGSLTAEGAAEPGVSEGSNSLALQVMGSLKDTYFGLAMMNTSGVVKYYAISSSKISDQAVDNMSVTLKSSGGFAVGTYTVYPFLSTVQSDISGQNKFFYPLPEIKPTTIKVISDSNSIYVDIIVYYKIVNKNTGEMDLTTGCCYIKSYENSKTYTGCTLYILKKSNNAQVNSRTIGNISPSYENTITFTGLDANTDYYMQLNLTYQGTTYNLKMDLDEVNLPPDYGDD